MERLLIVLENSLKNIKLSVDVYMVILGETAISRSFLIAQEIRTKLKMIVITESSKRSMKAQMKEANRQNASYVIIVGDNEINKEVVSIKDLKKGHQIEVNISSIIEYFEKIKKTK